MERKSKAGGRMIDEGRENKEKESLGSGEGGMRNDERKEKGRQWKRKAKQRGARGKGKKRAERRGVRKDCKRGQ